MVVIEQYFFGLFRYRKAFFPTADQAKGLLDQLAPNQVLRFACAPEAPLESRNLIRCEPVSTVFIDLRKSLRDIFSAMENHNCRRAIRRAERVADHVRLERNMPHSYGDFLAIYNDFVAAKRVAKRVMPAMSWKTLERYRSKSDVFVLYFDNRPFIGHLWLKDQDSKRVVHMFLGNRRLEKDTDSELHNNLNRYLHWHEIQYYKDLGMEIYDFGGIGHSNPHQARFNKFKLSFGGAILTESRRTYARPAALANVAVRVYEKLSFVRRSLGAI